MSNFVRINDENYEEIIKNNKSILIIFSSSSCGYCHIAKKNLMEILNQFLELPVYEYLIDNNNILANKYNINSIPVMILFIDGQVVHRFFGIRQSSDYYYQLKYYLTAFNNYK